MRKSQKIFVLFLLIPSLFFETSRFAAAESTKSKNTVQLVEISERNLRRNFFRTKKVDPHHDWLAVAPGPYIGQYYSRDTFISLMGGLEASRDTREKLAYAIDWFGAHMGDDGYIPMWFAESDQLNTYSYVPYNLTDKTGGIRQLDHVLEYVDAMYLYYKKTKNKKWLKAHIAAAEKARNYLEKRTDGFLLVGESSPYAGNDWADQILRSEKSTFVNAYWYKINVGMAEMYQVLGQRKRSKQLTEYAGSIKKAFNHSFWIESSPLSCDRASFGHYVAWRARFFDGDYPFDYFEMDSNMLAVAVGLADERKRRSIMDFVYQNFDYFVDQHGTTRVLCGHYPDPVTKIKPGHSQNGAYWYLPSYYLAMALIRDNNAEKLRELYNRVTFATVKYQEEGLPEWFYENGDPNGVFNYSWSLAFPIFLSSIINNTNAVYRLP